MCLVNLARSAGQPVGLRLASSVPGRAPDWSRVWLRVGGAGPGSGKRGACARSSDFLRRLRGERWPVGHGGALRRTLPGDDRARGTRCPGAAGRGRERFDPGRGGPARVRRSVVRRAPGRRRAAARELQLLPRPGPGAVAHGLAELGIRAASAPRTRLQSVGARASTTAGLRPVNRSPGTTESKRASAADSADRVGIAGRMRDPAARPPNDTTRACAA